MNSVELLGRLCGEPKVTYTQGENPMAVARYVLAVDRRRNRNQQDGQPTADFISCVAFGKGGEFAEKWLHKGTKIALRGHIQTGSYTNKDGQKVYTTDVVADEQEFAESKGSGNSAPAPQSNGVPADMQVFNQQQNAAANNVAATDDEQVPWLS